MAEMGLSGVFGLVTFDVQVQAEDSKGLLVDCSQRRAWKHGVGS